MQVHACCQAIGLLLLKTAVHCVPAAFVGSAVISSTAGGSADAAASAAGGVTALLNPLCVLGALGLGISLVQIHIYVDPLKRALQARVCAEGDCTGVGHSLAL